jgi:hypothetical protein
VNLTPEEAKLFFELQWGLQRFANQRKGGRKDISSRDQYEGLPVEIKLKDREALWNSPDLIDDYVKENPESLSTGNMEIIRSWRGFIKGEFLIFRHLKKFTIFIGNKNQVYGVVGLYDSLEEMIPAYDLPVMAIAVLLPFMGRIVYDGLLQSYSISFGGGIRSNLNQIYTAAKQKQRIITSLESVSGRQVPSVQNIVKSYLPQLEEIAAVAGKLKGKTALQNATLALLRASIEMAKTAESAQDDLGALFISEQKIRKAGSRLHNVLNIEAED